MPSDLLAGTDHVSLDQLDVEIIRALQLNARLSYRELSRKMGVSVTTISERVRRLLDLNVIRGFSAIVNPDKVGPSYCAVFYIKTGADSDVNAVAKKVSDVRGICYVYLTVGMYDLVAMGSSADKQDFSRLLAEVASVHGVREAVPSVILGVVKEDPKHPIKASVPVRRLDSRAG
ncbi:MAG: Lrp/AsnC family transcriptional regulator [Thermoprotei archaeon]